MPAASPDEPLEALFREWHDADRLRVEADAALRHARKHSSDPTIKQFEALHGNAAKRAEAAKEKLFDRIRKS